MIDGNILMNRGTVWKQNNRDKVRTNAKIYYHKNKEKVLANNERWKRNNPEYYLWHSARQRAKVNGLEFSIEVSDVVIPAICPALLVPLVWKDKEFGASIDRIDNSKGYVKGNIQVISKKANRMKNNATQVELENFSRWMMTHRKDLDDRWKNA